MLAMKKFNMAAIFFKMAAKRASVSWVFYDIIKLVEFDEIFLIYCRINTKFEVKNTMIAVFQY